MRTTAYAPKFVMSVLLASVAIGQCSGNIAILGGAAVVPSNLLHPAGLPLLIDPLTGTNGDFSQPASWKVGKTVGGSIDFVSAVYYDPTTKGLDFYYQIQNSGEAATTNLDTLSRNLSFVGFAGFTTNVFQIANVPGSPTNLFGSSSVSFKEPTVDTVLTVVRSGAVDNGNTLTVRLSGNGEQPGTNSAILEVQTNATDFDAAGEALLRWRAAPPANAVGAANQRSFDLSSLEPIATAPEPGFYGLLAIALIGLVWKARRSAPDPCH